MNWNEWLAEVMTHRPQRNKYLDCKRGIEIGRLCIDIERELFSWRRSDPDTFWIDVQLFVKYKLSDSDIEFILRHQPGIGSHTANAEERNAYAEMMRGLNKLKQFAERVRSEEK